MSPKIIDRENKRMKILLAAMKVFARQGVSNTKMAEIAMEAGIGKGTIYEYYRNKDEIFYESFRHFMEQTDSIVADRLNNIEDPVKKLEAWIDGWLEAIVSSIDFVAIMMDYWAEGIRFRSEASLINLEEMYDTYRQTIRQMLDEGIAKGKFRQVDTTLAASILIGTLDGLALQFIMNRNLFESGKITGILKDTFIQGLISNE